jgi:hypothetical protein
VISRLLIVLEANMCAIRLYGNWRRRNFIQKGRNDRGHG